MSDVDLGSLRARLLLDTSSAEKAIAGLAKGFGPAQKIAAGFGLAVLAIGVEAVRLNTQFQSALSSIQATTGQTAKQVQAIGDAFLSTMGDSTFSAVAIAEAFAPISGQLATVEGHALGAGDALLFMKDASNLAEATGADLASVTSALAGIMQAYSLPVSKAASATDVLFNVSGALALTIPTLATTIDRLHAKLGPLSPSLSDLGTLLIDMGEHGISGSRALLGLSAGMNTLLGNTKPVNAELTTLGVSLYTSSGQFVGMQSVIEQLAPKLANMTQEQQNAALKTLFGASASKILTSTILAGLPAWDSAAKAADKQGTAQAGAKTATDNLKGAIDKLKAGLSDILVSFGKLVTPILQLAATDALPAINAALKVMGTPPISTILVSTLAAIVISFTTFKAIAVGGEIVKMLQFMGAGGAADMITFGGASKAAFAPWLVAVGPITAIVAAILSLQGAKSGKTSIGNPFGINAPFLPGDKNNQLSTPWGTIPDTPVQTHNPVKAFGGPVIPGLRYTVGERGAEEFVSSMPGYIVPHDQTSGGGRTINITVNAVTNASPAEIGRQVAWQLKTAAI